MAITKEVFGNLPDGRTAYRFILENSRGTKAEITNFGAILLALWVRDHSGIYQDVVLGYDTLEEYFDNHPMFGATVGRCVNRISNASFSIGDQTYKLVKNRGNHNIHSDKEHGFHKVLWDYEITGNTSLKLTYVSVDGEQGFPGTLQVSLTYTLTEADGLMLSYYAVTNKPTLINMTNHSYFNLGGHKQKDILNTLFCIQADQYTPVDEDIIPTGELRNVGGTPMDFTTPASLRDRIHADFDQLKIEGGYDHNFVIRQPHTGIRKMAEAQDPVTGICMEVYSDSLGLQFYTSNSLASTKGKEGKVYGKYAGFCMEPDFFPNSINTEGFEKPIFTKDREYNYTTIYQFY